MPFDLSILMPPVLGAFVFSVAFGRHLGNFARYGDFSYGLYVWHFPILQTLVWAGAFAGHLNIGLGLVAIFAGGAAALSWTLIEKPNLRRDPAPLQAGA
jgi:peptidoglycan/LPS O-acetylase OafA/YrhL